MHFEMTLVKSAIEAKTCPIHGRHPRVSLGKHGKVSITTCCDTFQEICSGVVDEEYITIAERKANNSHIRYTD